MKKYVLTGGPGTGKSSIILALEQRGEYVIREAAEDYIRLRQAQGQPEPWNESDFQDKILKLQKQREAKIPAGTKRAFIDRGLADGLAYYQIEGRKPSKQMIKAIRKIKQEKPYEKVFLIKNLETYEKTDVRREDKEEALKLEKLQEQNYKLLGYGGIKIPAGYLKKRVEKIMLKIKKEHDAMKQNRKEEKENETVYRRKKHLGI